MRSDLAEFGLSRRLATAAGTVGLIVGLVAGCSDDVSIEPPRSTATALATDADQRVIDEVGSALAAGDAALVRPLAAPGAEGLLTSLAGNVKAVGLADVALRYVGSGPPLTEAQAKAYPPGARLAVVSVTYRIAGWDLAATRMETTATLVPSGDEVKVAGFGIFGDRTPLWLTGKLEVRRAPRVLVLAGAAGRADQLLRQGRQAVADVNAVLPGWKGRLVLEAPNSGAALTGALSAEPEQYDNIAAVTTSADGSLTPDAPVHVFTNPDVFDKLGPRGAQVVISHEATHVATGATFADMPQWLLEGFADYVALEASSVPLATAASQILAQVRKEGPPKSLPTQRDLDPSASDLGATYEEAWLACRFLAQTYGRAKLVAFYDGVDDGSTISSAFDTVLGTTEKEFVAAWSRDVARLAKMAG